jgi:hypothetical protein
MTALLIVLIVVVVVVIVALAATNPMMRKREDAAIKAVKDELGADNVALIEPRTTAMGTDPEDAGGLRGMACLALGPNELVAATWVGTKLWRVDRSAITAVDSAADDPGSVQKATITVTYSTDAVESGEATAMFRLREPAEWLTELGYDWGEAGPPETETDEAD